MHQNKPLRLLLAAAQQSCPRLTCLALDHCGINQAAWFALQPLGPQLQVGLRESAVMSAEEMASSHCNQAVQCTAASNALTAGLPRLSDRQKCSAGLGAAQLQHARWPGWLGSAAMLPHPGAVLDPAC